MKKSMTIGAAVGVVGLSVTLAACGAGSSGSDENTLRVAYQTTATFDAMQTLMENVKEQYEAENEGMTVELVPVQAEGNDYYTKLALMNKSASTAPDVMYEDTFKVQADAAAGYLLPLDDYLAEWDEWDQFAEGAKQAGLGGDGQTYGVSLGTDTRGLWYNEQLLEDAGIEVPWAPATWQDVLDAAEAVKESNPDVIPLNVYSGKASGEAASMQGFEMLLYGTDDTLYDAEAQKWVTGSQGFIDSLQFLVDVYQGELGPSLQEALDPNVGTSVTAEWLPGSELAIALDGSWQSSAWVEGGTAEWPEWEDTLGIAAMPTQNGQEPGSTSMSGGWTLAIGAESANPDAAWDLITLAVNQENAKAYDIEAGQIAVRNDVAEDPEYLEANSSFEPFSAFVETTHFRPATADYDQISNAIQVAMEAVMTGQSTPEEAAAAYDEAVIGIVGEENTQAG
jgi:multiple sugar transport system substrate-binding protein